MKFAFLRKKHPRFIYEDYSYGISKGGLEIFFDFLIEPDVKFKPRIIIKNIDKHQLAKMGEEALNNFVFHLGLMEIPTYWKATCSPEIIIKAGHLDEKQTKWWKDLIIKGMGQFFYENKIDWRKPNFLKITTPHLHRSDLCKSCAGKLKNRYLVPFAGGRDSIITLERLKKSAFAKASTFASRASADKSAGKQKKKIALFLVNPSKQIQKAVRISNIKKQIIIKREIDKKLLKLNNKGYLNGHTPFTAVLSFLSVFCGVLFNYKNIVFSNEKSADEGNVKYLGRIINHQWAKSSEFERMFKKYCKNYLAKNINYFSFLRKYTELEISKMFTKYPEYFPVFSSCNVGMKIKGPPSLRLRRVKWCGNCPKCLFVYTTLYPFLDKKQLFEIFGKDIFENKKLLPAMKGLMGREKTKPFECVGTYRESKKALKLCFKKAKKSGKIPYLLQKLNDFK